MPSKIGIRVVFWRKRSGHHVVNVLNLSTSTMRTHRLLPHPIRTKMFFYLTLKLS